MKSIAYGEPPVQVTNSRRTSDQTGKEAASRPSLLVSDERECRYQGVTVNGIELLAKPPTLTTTLPVAAPVGTVTVMLLAAQDTTGAATALTMTVLAPWFVPKLMPAIAT